MQYCRLNLLLIINNKYNLPYKDVYNKNSLNKEVLLRLPLSECIFHCGRTESVRPIFGLSASHLRVLAEPLFGPYFRALTCTQSRCSVQPTYESYDE